MFGIQQHHGGEEASIQWCEDHFEELSSLPPRIRHDLLLQFSMKMIYGISKQQKGQYQAIVKQLEKKSETVSSNGADLQMALSGDNYIFATPDRLLVLLPHISNDGDVFPLSHLLKLRDFEKSLYQKLELSQLIRNEEGKCQGWWICSNDIGLQCNLNLLLVKTRIRKKVRNILFIAERAVAESQRGKGVGRYLLALTDAIAVLNECSFSFGVLRPFNQQEENLPLLKRGHRQAGYRVHGNIAVKVYEKQ
ncbi:MAG: hypothetical protein WCV62_01200 [Candidatus Peribacteraceae bacterium]|jgi:hypothetical protein